MLAFDAVTHTTIPYPSVGLNMPGQTCLRVLLFSPQPHPLPQCVPGSFLVFQNSISSISCFSFFFTSQDPTSSLLYVSNFASCLLCFNFVLPCAGETVCKRWGNELVCLSDWRNQWSWPTTEHQKLWNILVLINYRKLKLWGGEKGYFLFEGGSWPTKEVLN